MRMCKLVSAFNEIYTKNSNSNGLKIETEIGLEFNRIFYEFRTESEAITLLCAHCGDPTNLLTNYP